MTAREVFDGSDAELTKAYYKALESRGAVVQSTESWVCR